MARVPLPRLLLLLLSVLRACCSTPGTQDTCTVPLSVGVEGSMHPGDGGEGARLWNGITLPSDTWPPRYGRECVDCRPDSWDPWQGLEGEQYRRAALRTPFPVPYLTPAGRPSRLDVTVGRQVFVDDFLLDTGRSSGWQRVWHSPQRSEQPVSPWASAYHGGMCWDAAHQQLQVFRFCHYLNAGRYDVCMDVSSDGLSWTPADLQDDCGTAQVPNRVFVPADDDVNFHEFTMHCDATIPGYPGRWQYVLYVQTTLSPPLLRNSKWYWGKVFAKRSSTDAWQHVALGGTVIDAGGGLWHNPFRDVWSLCVRPFFSPPFMRTLHYLELHDFARAQWDRDSFQQLRPLFFGDLDDARNVDALIQGDHPALCADPSRRLTDAYGAAFAPYESVVLALVTMWRGGHTAYNKLTQVNLATSRDGYHFQRNRQSFIWQHGSMVDAALAKHGRRLGDLDRVGSDSSAGEQDRALLADMLPGAWTNAHGVMNGVVTWPEHVQVFATEHRQEPGGPMELGMFAYTLRRDGFASMRAVSAGVLQTAEFVMPANRPHLFINIALSADADILVHECTSVSVCDGVSHAFGRGLDATAFRVPWNTRQVVAGAPLRLRFTLRAGTADVYSFWYSDRIDGALDTGRFVGPGGVAAVPPAAPYLIPSAGEDAHPRPPPPPSMAGGRTDGGVGVYVIMAGVLAVLLVRWQRGGRTEPLLPIAHLQRAHVD